MDDLVDYLLNDFAPSHNIGYEYAPLPPSFNGKALPSENLIIVNSQWSNRSEIPFICGHEIGHIIHGDTLIKCEAPTANYPAERAADLYSLNLIYKYAINNGVEFNEPGQFIQEYGIPIKMLPDACKFFK